MKISGFTFTRNAEKLYYPVKASIESILPVVDEFVVALGNGAADDRTEEEIRSIASDKIKIIHTEWDLEKYNHGKEYAHQTDIAKEACSGDWLFYLQGDEVVHEKYLQEVQSQCKKYLDNKHVEGLLFQYKHFWGDYDHYVLSHAWYAREIRIIRNDPDIHSWRDAQSFRKMPDFDGMNYYRKENTAKLNVAELDATIYHYGFVRPPHIMQKKNRNHSSNYIGSAAAAEKFKSRADDYDYGNLSQLRVFKETHPAVMQDFISRFDWKELLRYQPDPDLPKLKHEKLKYRLLSFIEQKFRKGNTLFGFQNFNRIKGK